MLTRFPIAYPSFYYLWYVTLVQPRTVAGGPPLQGRTSLEQLESAEQIDSFGEVGCGGCCLIRLAIGL